MPATFHRTVAELLLGHAESRSTGVLTLSRGQVRKQLFLREGVLVSADSNLREEALGELLVAMELLPRPRLNQLLEEVKRRGQKMGTVVIELGWVSPDDVMAALREQVRRRAEGCLRSPDTEAQFEARSDFVGNLIEHRFELVQLVFTGLRATSTLEMLAPLLDTSDAQEVHLEPRFNRFRAEFEAAFGGELTDLLQTGCDLGTLVMRPDASELVYALEALLMAGLATVAPASATVDRTLSGTESSKLPLRDGWQSDTQPELRADFRRDPSTGGGSFGPPGSQGTPTTDPTLPRDVMREFLEVHGRHARDVLGVREGASKAELDRALAAKRARLLGLGAVGPHQGLIDELLEAYTRAHAALDNPTRPDARRSTALYGTVAGADPGMDPLGAELAFGEGHALLLVGRPADAIAHFRKAVDKRPDQASYHAILGWTLFQVHLRQAMPEALDRLEHAVAVDPDSAEAHALLGALLAALGEPGRARGHLERTLVLRPEQPRSIELLSRLYVEASEPELAEKLYRRVLGALGERELPLRRTLWRELAELYEGPLMDTTSAARAYAVAAHLDPSDASLPKKAAAALTAGIARGEGLE
jgi:tetratricopeptide (TPR) repeat protein